MPLVGPGQFRSAATQDFVLVNPERYRGRHGVSAVESRVRIAVQQRLREFMDPDVADFITILLLRTNTVIAEAGLIEGQIKLGQIYVSGQKFENLVLEWSRFVQNQPSLDIAQRALLQEVDALIGPVQPKIPTETAQQRESRQLEAALERGQTINLSKLENASLKEKIKDSLIKEINRVAHPFEAARNIAAELIQGKKVQVRLVRSQSRIDRFEVEEVFIGHWRLDIFLRELEVDIQRNGIQKYLQRHFEEDRRRFLGPTSRLISSIYERGRHKQ